MKIQCDVCNKQTASLFCTADEAALCDGCDHRVHHDNKLASKHQRFSLSHPTPKHFPVCDICQETRALMFCQQDRAILCKDCDVSIHSANELTKKHNRFLLTGIKFSATATPYSSSTQNKNPLLDSSQDSSTLSPPKPGITNQQQQQQQQPGFVGSSSSSISEYLINTIPGMNFEDFLDSHSLPCPLSKNGDGMFGEGNMISFTSGGIWVPEAPSSASVYSSQMNNQSEYRVTRDGIGNSRSNFGDDNFIVPQMNPPNKRSKLLW